MIFRQLFEKESSTYTYILGDEATKEAVIIDPVIETAERDIKLLQELGLTLKYDLNTHVHAGESESLSFFEAALPVLFSLFLVHFPFFLRRSHHGQRHPPRAHGLQEHLGRGQRRQGWYLRQTRRQDRVRQESECHGCHYEEVALLLTSFCFRLAVPYCSFNSGPHKR